MTRYKTIFDHYRAYAAAWAARETDAYMALEESAPRLTPDQMAEFVEDFCSRAGKHVEEVGADVVGQMIWYLMGAGEEVWHTVREASLEYAEDAVRSLLYLYERCFAEHLPGWGGFGRESPPLASACFMLWDMDGGLLGIPLFGEPKNLVPICFEVLEHALTLDAPECWASALHGLGHVASSHRERVQGAVDAFLAAKGRRVPDDLRQYALGARSGGVQ